LLAAGPVQWSTSAWLGFDGPVAVVFESTLAEAHTGFKTVTDPESADSSGDKPKPGESAPANAFALRGTAAGPEGSAEKSSTEAAWRSSSSANLAGVSATRTVAVGIAKSYC